MLNPPHDQASPQLPLDFRRLFESAPALYLVLAPDADFTLLAMTDAYARATMIRREDVIGRALFEVFPDNPDDPHATGSRIIRASLERVLRTQRPDSLPLQRYDIRRPASEGGGFETRFWIPNNSPVLGPSGEVIAILHEARDVTDRVRSILHVEDGNDVVTVRLKADELAHGLRFNPFEREALVTAVSELATNIRLHAARGRVTFALLQEPDRVGLETTFEDTGDGIGELDKALMGGHSTVGTLGLGLSGSRRLVDDFQISTRPGQGTQITIRKWISLR